MTTPDERSDFEPPSERGSEAPTEGLPPEALWPGRILGDRYRIERRLGRGGMGEVWLALDLKLCVPVALKRMLPVPGSEARRELLRQEVRVARGVLSPNVCRIFDLIEYGGQELLSMEYVNGTTLIEHLRERGPLPIGQATEIASQMLAGLQCIHDAGLVHRDVKPENVMITPAGRVVLMDFGVAKQAASMGHGTIAGTPAYMAPEQLRGSPVDERTDIFAAGIVLAELSHPQRLSDPGGRERLWNGVRRSPSELPEGPWKAVLERATAQDPEARYPSARALASALEEVTLRNRGKVSRSPFPGLAPFVESDADYFFGREADIEKLGERLNRLHMLALVGPSGIGKSSFLRAGLIPSLPSDWACVVCTPGRSPLVSLGQALAPHLAGDPESMRALLRFGETDVALSTFKRWRARHKEALLVVDQFEELFTQNLCEAQNGFAELLGRLPLEAGVRVLLSVRDDFLFACHSHPELRPILMELTLLAPLRGGDLRRALVQPASRCGYRFEDEGLVEEMMASVENERGALPLLAFTAARLWEHRDQERGLLTRDAYQAIGGVVGSLTQHAESTLSSIGSDHQEVVREVFRNLVTAQGTRVSRARNELLSVFEDREVATEVLARLIDARLLSSFETPDPQDPSRREQRLEVVHESLLSNWPRLVRWQTQDADGAQLRDQLRQAAEVWEARSRSEDLLWSGTAYQELRLWRERYPGGLTDAEEAFIAATTELARRERRRRRAMLVAAFAGLLLVLAVVGGLWLRSEQAHRVAVTAARRAEAGKLSAIAQGEPDPTQALAYALAALELSDQPEFRRVALRILMRAPGAFQLPRRPDSQDPHASEFSPDGNWLAVGWGVRGGLQLYSLDGGAPRDLPGHRNRIWSLCFSDDSKLLATTAYDSTVRLWSVPEGRLLRTLQFAGPVTSPHLRAGRLLTCEFRRDQPLLWKSWPLDGGDGVVLGRTGSSVSNPEASPIPDLDPAGTLMILPEDREVLVYSMRSLGDGPLRVLGRHADPIVGVRYAADGDRFLSYDRARMARLWSSPSSSGKPMMEMRVPVRAASAGFSRAGTRAAFGGMGVSVQDLRSPGGTPALIRPGLEFVFTVAFDPNDQWLATTSTGQRAEVWPVSWLDRIPLRDSTVYRVAISPDGRWLATASANGVRIQVRSLDGTAIGAPRTLYEGLRVLRLGWDDESRSLFATTYDDARGLIALHRMRIQDGARSIWEDMSGHGLFLLSPRADWVATSGDTIRGKRIELRNLASGQAWFLGRPEDGPLGFLADGEFLRVSGKDVVASNPIDHSEHVFLAGCDDILSLCPDRERFLCWSASRGYFLRRLDGMETGRLPFKSGGDPQRLCMVPGDLYAFGYSNGDVELARASDRSTTRVPAHGDAITDLSIHPTGRYIASISQEGLKLWAVPGNALVLESSREQFLEALRGTTNLRAIPDDQSPIGYRIEARGLPDWRHPPRW